MTATATVHRLVDDESAQGNVATGNILLPGESDAPLYLTRKQIAEILQVTDGKLRGYAEAGETFFGGQSIGGKGVRYPESAVALFREVIATMTPTQFRDRVSEGTAGSALVVAGQAMQSLGEGRGNALAVADSAATVALTHATEHLSELIADVISRAVPAAPDRLVDADEGAAMLAVSGSTLRRLIAPVKVGSRNRWRVSDIHRYIASL